MYIVYGVANLPLADSLLLSTCTVNSIKEMSLRINTGCTDPLFSLILYADWLNFIVITKYNKETHQLQIVEDTETLCV